MTSIESRPKTPAKRTNSATSIKADKQSRKSSIPHVAKKAEPVDGPQTTRVTVQDRILTLLGRREGATIPDMMKVSGWQQHSVRGFLAGTVRKKLGLTLTSSKAEGETRRYRLATSRVR